ncbi:MAG TPA: VIT domain-containing protein [Kofleriaceae bacterium]|nr:VIT domain-containing protein [Kofleriaceae bacterium]
MAEVEVLRPGVTVGGKALADAERLSAGGVIEVGAGGRAWLSHDAPLRLLADGGAKVAVRDDGVAIERGRVWIEGAEGAHAQVVADAATLDAAGAAFELDRAGGKVRVHVGRGVVSWRAGAQRGQIHAGEDAELTQAGATVTPSLLWDDWTGGLAWPDSGAGAGRRGFGEIGARRPGSLGEARFPLAITRLEVRAQIEDDAARVRVVQSFFNPASTTLEGLYRVRIPEGAILQRFAIDRDGRWADGYVKERETARAQYQAQVYEGSTRDPALLEWDAPGSYRARIYPIPAGATRRILIEYSEWITPHGNDGERTWRYPMSGGADAPVIEELDVEVDATAGGARTMRAGLNARIVDGGKKVTLERTDFRPAADLVVDLVGGDRKAGEARGYRSPHRLLRKLITGEDDYYLVRAMPLPAEPATERAPVDWVILTDVSAATDATHLQLARTTVEALLRHLDDKDRVAVLGADLEVRQPGAPKPSLSPASRATTDAMMDALARQGTGGASDLGAVLVQAASLLDPKRRGAVIYVGDALPTVGELDRKTLQERLDRLPAPLRLYGVAIGDESNLALLDALSADGGLSLRVNDRAAAAGAALRILGHATRRILSRVTVDLGSGVDRVYPRRPVTVVEGDALPVLARVRGAVPSEVTISGWLAGTPWKQKMKVSTRTFAADQDLRLRWAQERLRQLLADGASAEEVAELGTRQNLITPFTSYYVPSAAELSRLLYSSPTRVAAAGFGCSYRSPGAKSEAASEPSPVSVPVGSTATTSPGAPPPPPAEAPTRERVAAADQEEAAPQGYKDSPAPPAASAAPAPMPMKSAKKMDTNDALGGDPQNAFGGLSARPMDEGKMGKGGGGTGSGTIGLGNIGSRRAAAAHSGILGAESGAHRIEMDKKVSRDGEMEESKSAFGDRGGVWHERPVRDESGVEGGDLDDRIEVRITIGTHRARHCSSAASLSPADRATLWRERLTVHRGVNGALEIWQDAQGGCELKTWGDRRELLRAMLSSVGNAGAMVQLYHRFSDDPGAQDFLRRAILGAVRTAADLRTVVDGIGASEEVQWTMVETLIAKAKTPEERVATLEQLAARWPDNLRLKLRRIEAREAVKRLAEARRLADEVRADPYADAQARTLVGEFLVRTGDEPGARRAFSEIVEFAPRDPQARRRLGDLYRAHGWFEEAYRQYQTLGELSQGDPAVLLLLGAAAAGAGRIDEALRLEQRVSDGTEPGSETGLAKVALWWSSVRLALLRAAARDKNDAPELARLMGRTRRANVLADARPFRVFLTWAHPEADCELSVQLPGSPMSPATDLSPEHGIAGFASREPLQSAALVEVKRPQAGAGLRYQAQVIIVWNEGDKAEQLQTIPLDFGPGKAGYRIKIEDKKAEVLQ